MHEAYGKTLATLPGKVALLTTINEREGEYLPVS